MRPMIRNFTLRDVNLALEEMDRRVAALEASTTVTLPTSAPRSPMAGGAWMDIESGKINVWDGSSWTTYTKD